MAINMKKYVDITSGSANTGAASRRNMGARCFTTSQLVGVNNVREFTDADSVMAAFGSNSNEYKFAAAYFAFVSKSVTKAKKISFARWPNTASKACVASTSPIDSTDLEKIKTISNGTLKIKVGSGYKQLTGIDFTTSTRTNETTPSTATGHVESISADAATFGQKVSYSAGLYEFTYSTTGGAGGGGTWMIGTSPVTLSEYGVTVTQKSETATAAEESPRISSVSVTAATFGTKVSHADGTYTFTYSTTEESWMLGSGSSAIEVDLEEYGVVVTPVSEETEFTDEDVFTVTYVSNAFANTDNFSIDYTTTVVKDVQKISDVFTKINAAVAASSDTFWKGTGSTANATFGYGGASGFSCSYVEWDKDYTGHVSAFEVTTVNTSGSWDLASCLKMVAGANPILSDACSAQTPVEAVAAVDAINDNFGSFMFLPKEGDAAPDLTAEEIAAVATGNAGRNMKYLYSVAVSSSNYDQVVAALSGQSDVCVTYYDDVKGWACEEYMPMALFAATDYTRPNSTKCNMFQQFASAVTSVDTDEDSAKFDALRVNYYGCTQKAGKLISFYQRGYNVSGLDTACFCNEVWMKDAIETECLNLFLAKEKIPANEAGRAIVQIIIKGVVDEAIYNGTIMPQATLTNTEKSVVNTLANDDTACDVVGTNGYWLSVNVKRDEEDANKMYYADYVLIYKKGDAIRKVVGSDVLI